jgi:hypothetical protein
LASEYVIHVSHFSYVIGIFNILKNIKFYCSRLFMRRDRFADRSVWREGGVSVRVGGKPGWLIALISIMMTSRYIRPPRHIGHGTPAAAIAAYHRQHKTAVSPEGTGKGHPIQDTT